MRAFKCARSDVQRRRDDPLDLQGVESDAGARDVNDRINRSDLVEVNSFDRDVVNLRLGLADALKDGLRALFGALTQA
jgi:hypothetical protein